MSDICLCVCMDFDYHCVVALGNGLKQKCAKLTKGTFLSQRWGRFHF